MKKLLIVTTVPETMDTILRYQPRFLNDHFDVHLATSSGERIKSIEDNESISINVVPMVRGINPFFDLYSICMMIKLLVKIEPDVIHSYTPKAGLISMLAGFACRVPVRIHTFTGLIFPTTIGIKKKILMFVDRLICKCATVIVPEGQGVKHDLISNSITTKKMDVIGNGNIAGVDTIFFSKDDLNTCNMETSFSNFIDNDSDEFVFCFIGRLNKDKGLSELVNAFKRLPKKSHLLIVGSIDQSSPLDNETLVEMKQHERIHLLGYQQDIRQSLLMSNVLVLPSYREGFPNVLLQAGSMGLPTIASNINGCNEIIEHGNNGWLVEPKDSESLYIMMKEAMSCNDLSDMGVRARNNVVNKFERREHWNRMLAFYQERLNTNETVY